MSNFPIWKTVKIEENGQKFEIDLVKIRLEDLGFYLTTNIDDVRGVLGRYCLACIDDAYIDKIANELLFRTKIFVIGKMKWWDCEGFNKKSYSGSFYVFKLDELVFMQLRTLRATAGAPLQAA